MEKTLSIGQVIYVLSNKAQKIVPAIVVEEIQVKKIDGNTVQWKVSIGPKNKEKIVDSTRIDGEIYSSLDEIRKILFDRLSGFLDELITDTEKRVENWYGKQVNNEQNSNLPINETDRIDPESLMETIENNDMQLNKNDKKAVSVVSNSQNSLRERLRQELSDDNNSEQIVGQEEILMPDGSVIKAKIRSNV